MIFTVLTLFPRMFESPLSESMLNRAIQRGNIVVEVVDIRDFAAGKHRQADDRPYGGGSGMVLMVQPVADAVQAVFSGKEGEKRQTVLLSPSGRLFHQGMAAELAELDRLVLICGHYEGVDDRINTLYADEEVSIGDYVLTGGELAAMVIIDAVARLLPGVVGDPNSLVEETFDEQLLEYPQYTRPEIFKGLKVPEVLLSGHHENIRRWRRKERLKRTLLRRPDLLENKPLTPEDLELLEAAMKELES